MLSVGKHGTAYIRARCKGLTDAGERKAARAKAVQRLQDELDDQCGSRPPSVDDACRAYGVASVFGEADAAGLTRGKLEAFAVAVVRDRATEEWNVDPALAPELCDKVSDFWTAVCLGLDTDADGKLLTAEQCKARVRVLVGKAKAEELGGAVASTTATAGASEAQTVTATTSSGSPLTPGAAAGVPAAAVADALRTAKAEDVGDHIAALLRGRCDVGLILRQLGMTRKWTVAADQRSGDLTGLVEGLYASGKLDAIVLLMRACGDAYARNKARMQAAEAKTEPSVHGATAVKSVAA